MAKRLFDIIFSIIGVIILFPFLIIISLFIIVDSKGGAFYTQNRVGKNNVDFSLYKFRTMKTDSDKKGLLTVGNNDVRITNIGYTLRKYKIDEMPQLFNVLNGTMSFVGPRPEVRKYVKLYTEDQKQILNVKPGITDYASLEYFNENELLGRSENPEETYIKEVLPAKIKLNKKYINNQGLGTDISIIFKTFKRIIS
jgi:lipopolysaccharide/colanic/teichoic acid biosynthesis glycosyltransferase